MIEKNKNEISNSNEVVREGKCSFCYEKKNQENKIN